jgi:hypothetical protein
LTDDPITVGERYAKATVSKNLTPLEQRCDADVLLAAGIAASGDPKLQLALSLYRLQVQGSTEGLHAIAEAADAWLQSRLSRGGNHKMPVAARTELMLQTLAWWINQTCRYCNGTGYEAAEQDGRHATIECGACHGTRIKPLAREVPNRYFEHARWLADRLDANVLIIQARMAKLLSERMEL